MKIFRVQLSGGGGLRTSLPPGTIAQYKPMYLVFGVCKTEGIEIPQKPTIQWAPAPRMWRPPKENFTRKLMFQQNSQVSQLGHPFECASSDALNMVVVQ